MRPRPPMTGQAADVNMATKGSDIGQKGKQKIRFAQRGSGDNAVAALESRHRSQTPEQAD